MNPSIGDNQPAWYSSVRPAHTADAEAIAELLNLAYRSGQGWTHEHHLVAGMRADALSVGQYIAGGDGCYLIIRPEQLLACIHVAPFEEGVIIGSFAVHPDHQGKGLGASLLSEAERYAKEVYAAAEFYMDVLAPRSELIAYYLRKGYQLTGESRPFPHEANAGDPFDAELKVVRLVKRMQSNDG